MKSFYLLLAIAFSMLNLSPKVFAQTAQTTIPYFDQVDKITISSHGGWVLEIHRDGSASLGYGSLPTDNAQIPKQTFSFQDVYNLLTPHLSGNYPGEKAIAVALYVKGLTPGTPTYALYLDDRRIVRQIMTEARDKSVPLDQNRFKELVAKHSPVPDDTQ